MGFGLEVVTPAVCGLLPLSAVSGDGRPSGRAVCPLDGRCVRFHRSHSGRSPDPQARCCVRRTYRVTSVSHVRESRRVQSLVSANGRSEWSSSEQFWLLVEPVRRPGAQGGSAQGPRAWTLQAPSRGRQEVTVEHGHLLGPPSQRRRLCCPGGRSCPDRAGCSPAVSR